MAVSSSRKIASPLNVSLAYQGFLDEPVPSSLFDAAVSGSIARMVGWAKNIFCLLAGILIATAAWYAFEKGQPNSAALVDAHTVALSSHSAIANDAVYPVRVGVKDLEHLNSWLSFRLGKAMQVQNLDKIGYKLLGGNIVPDVEGVSALIVYEGQKGNRLSLFYRTSDDASKLSAVEFGQNDKHDWLSWKKSGGRMVLVGELSEVDLQKIRNALI